MELKIWYNNRVDSKGTVYKEFATVTKLEAFTAIKAMKDTVTLFNPNTATGKEISHHRYLGKKIVRECNLIFLNRTQAKHLGFKCDGRNCALLLKDSDNNTQRVKTLKITKVN